MFYYSVYHHYCCAILMLHYLMLHFLNLHYLLMHYLMLHYVNVPLFYVALLLLNPLMLHCLMLHYLLLHNSVLYLEKKKNFMTPFYGWGSAASRLQPLRGGSLLFTIHFPEIPGTHFIDLGRMKG